MNDSRDSQASKAHEEKNPYARSTTSHREPPVGLTATSRHLGPGMILAGSIVGSGELMMTTKLGAEAGFILLWFVLLSCVIKVVVQGELARHTISSGETFLHVFNALPGPHYRRPVWLDLEWMAVTLLASLAGLTYYTVMPRGDVRIFLGVVGFVIAWAAFITWRRQGTGAVPRPNDNRPALNWFIWFWLPTQILLFINGGAILGGAAQALNLALPASSGGRGAVIWSLVVAALCAAVLLSGRYKLLEQVSLALVASFTAITIVCTGLLQWTGYAITPADVQQGLTFALPGPLSSVVVLTALAMYAGTGIGTNEMISYTYWCVEKGYARAAGEREPGDEWPRRARGWIRVMYTDVLITMAVYTIGTVCFYFLGAAILHPKGLTPEGTETLAILGNLYTETLGSWAATLFVVGGFFILFSTSVSGIAGNTRILADALCVMRIISPYDYSARLRFIRIFVVVSLAVHIFTYALFQNPPLMLVISAMISVVIYPALGLGTLYLRYRDVDPRIRPGRLTSGLLWVSGLALAVISPAAVLLALAIRWEWLVL